MLAGLCRFYGGTPAGYLAMPFYQLRTLIDFQPAIEAEELRAQVAVVSMPNASKNDRQRYLHTLERIALPLRPRPAPPPPQTAIEYDPVKAAEWFAAHGYEVVSDG